MAFTWTRTVTLSDGTDRVIGSTGTASDDMRDGYDGTIVAGTEPQIQLAFDMDDVTGVAIVASGALDLNTNAAHTGSPAQTIPLTANREIVWLTGDNAAMPFTANVTSIFARNVGVADVTLKIRILRNSI